MTKKVLVTGGAGYIGSHTCKALRSAGYEPVAFDNLSTGHREFVRWGPLVVGDVRDAAAVTEAARYYSVVSAIHFAASAYVGESVIDPAKYYDNNVSGTLSLLNGLRAAGCNDVVVSSTCAVYGQPDRNPIDETFDPRPINPYGRSKWISEQIVADFARAYGTRAIVLRYFNACGADPDCEVGELRDPETHLIPRLMMAIQGHIDDFSVHGNDFPTPDGTAIRDYIHVSDLAAAHVCAMQKLLDESRTGTFNLGTGQGHSVNEVLREVQNVCGTKIAEISGPRREGDPAILVANPSLARTALGFEPCQSDLKTVVRTAWAWHLQAHPKRTAGA